MQLFMPAIGKKIFLVNTLQATLKKTNSDLIACDLNAAPAAGNFADFFYQMPRITDPAFESQLLEICDKHAIRTILPTRQQEFVWWNNFTRRHPHFQVLLSGRQTIDICGDKLKSYSWLKANKFPVAPYALKGTQSLEALVKILGVLPWFSKPFDGSASQGTGAINSAENFDKLPANTILQPILKGNEYTINCYVDKLHRCRAVIPHRRLEVREGEVSVGVTVREEYLINLGRRLAEALPDSFGPLNFQVFHDPSKGLMSDKSVVLTDLNARFGGGYPLVHGAGGHFARWLLLEADNRPLPLEAGQWVEGTRLMRTEDGGITISYPARAVESKSVTTPEVTITGSTVEHKTVSFGTKA